MDVHTGDVGCVSGCAYKLQIVFGLDDCSFNFWKVQDRAWESPVLDGHTSVVNCVSASAEGVQDLSASLEETK